MHLVTLGWGHVNHTVASLAQVANHADYLSPLYLILGILVRGLVLAPFMVPTVMKGKWGFFVFGWIFPIFWIVGAIRLAMPDSYWAGKFYGPSKMSLARARFHRRLPDSGC